MAQPQSDPDPYVDLHLHHSVVVAPNGEDYLFLFTNLELGAYLQLKYNLICQEADTPHICHGQAFFDDGSMVSFRSQESAQKHHALQVWQTPFVGPNFQADVETDSMLYKIRNRELVQGMAECQELLQLIDKDDSYAELYVDLVKRSTDALDSYFWLERDETMRLSEPLQTIRESPTVYRAEYLAADLFFSWSPSQKAEFSALAEKEQVEQIQVLMQTRHDEGYSRGVHDADAANILRELLNQDSHLGFLRYEPDLRGSARYVWTTIVPAAARTRVETKIAGLATVRQILPKTEASKRYVKRIRSLLVRYGKGILDAATLDNAAEFLFEQLQRNENDFVLSRFVDTTLQRLHEYLPKDECNRLIKATDRSRHSPLAALTVALDAVDGYLAEDSPDAEEEDAAAEGNPRRGQHYRAEFAAQLPLQNEPTELGPDVEFFKQLEGLSGDHARIQSGRMKLHYHEFTQRLGS
ncbi:MAG: DNA repair ATPase [Planctomycetota bacterium]|nr:DNA repair ATPase [Planctomycetota bacterium]